MKKVLLTVILTAISFSQVSALQVDLSNGSGSIEISQKDIGKLTPEQIEQAKIQVPQNFRIR